MLQQEVTQIFTSFTLSSHVLATLLYVITFAVLQRKTSQKAANRPLIGLIYGLIVLQIAPLAVETNLLAPQWLTVFYIVCYGFWHLALIRALEFATTKPVSKSITYGVFLLWLLSIPIILITTVESFSVILNQIPINTKNTWFFALIINLLAVLILGEQTLRNAGRAYRAHIRYAYFGVGIITLTHIYQTGYIYLFNEWEPLIPIVDGYLSIAVGVLFLMSTLRNQPNQPLSVSRSIAFYSTSITLIGLFLLSMGAAGYYANVNSDNWSSGIQLVIFFATFVGVCFVTFSPSLRRSIRVFVNKHFFRHKYDYRSVWLELIQTFSDISEKENFHSLSVQAIAKIFDANGGAMWLKKDGSYQLKSVWDISDSAALEKSIDENVDFLTAFSNDEWIYAFNKYNSHREFFHQINPPLWVSNIPDIWIFAPLKVGSNLVGFIALTREMQDDALIWEDIDVIKSASRQLASYIVRLHSAEQLAESKQFDTYNKLTAFIMHDLKNLIAQQALVVKNANKHKDNPAFVEDAILTIDNSVQRMSHLLSRLQRSPHQATNKSVSLKRITLEAIRKATDRQPIPTLRTQTDGTVLADQDQLTMILMHIIRNAQDATANDDFIDIKITPSQKMVSIEIEDNGHGMDEDFIKNRLFKPFESTKSSMGMGIGAYQVREFIHAMGGIIRVKSEPGVGTTVCIELPLATEIPAKIDNTNFHIQPNSRS